MSAHVLILSLMFTAPSARAADVVVVQAGQMYLNQGAEAKADAIKNQPSLGKNDVVKTLRVKRGDRVVFKNRDKVTHNVYGDGFDLHAQEPGATTTQAFDTPGVQTIKCAIHPKMKFQLEVEP